MPRPTVRKEMTTSNVAKLLDMSTTKVINWIDHKVLPPPTDVDENGTRYFNEAWLEQAKDIVKRKTNGN